MPNVSVIDALAPAKTLVGANATVMVGVAAATIVMVNPCIPVPPALVAVTVAPKVPVTVGVPEINPVAVLTVRLAGSPLVPKLVGALVAVIV